MTTQLELPFDEAVALEAIPVGAIVIQTWPWIGKYQEIIPYWQVRASRTDRQMLEDRIRREHKSWPDQKVEREILKVTEDTRKMYTMNNHPIPEPKMNYLCDGLPHGMRPMEIHWFSSEDVMDTGLRWKVVSDEEQNRWCARAATKREDGTSYNSPYVRSLGASHWCPDKKRCEQLSGRWCGHWPPYKEEQGLLDLLATLPPAFPRWDVLTSRAEYEDLAPRLIEILRRKRV